MPLIDVGANPAYFPAWLHGFSALEVVAVVVSLVLTPFAMKLAMTIGADKTTK